MRNNELNFLEMGKRTHDARKKLDLTGDRLGGIVGCDRSTISRFENGLEKNPSLKLVHSIAKNLEVPLDWLCDGDENKLAEAVELKKALEEKVNNEIDERLSRLASVSISSFSLYEKNLLAVIMQMIADMSQMRGIMGKHNSGLGDFFHIKTETSI